MRAAYESIHQQGSLAAGVGKGRRKKVTFGHIEIYEHAIEMGDNPSVSDGAPITIGWSLQSKRAFDISYFETYFPSEERRRNQSLKLSVAQRAKILLRAGYSMFDIMECTLNVMKEKHIRNESLRSRKWDTWNALVEKTTRTIRKAARRPRRASLRGANVSKTDTIGSLASTGETIAKPPFIDSHPSHLATQTVRKNPVRRVSLGPVCSLDHYTTVRDDCNSSISSQPFYDIPFSPIVSPEKKRAKRLDPARNLPPSLQRAARDVVFYDHSKIQSG